MQSKNTHFTAYSLHFRRMRNKRPTEDIWLPQIRRDFYKPWMDKFKSDDPILDIGCGWGHQIFILHHLGFNNIRGIEIVEDSLRIAIEEVGEMGSIELADAFDYLADGSKKFSVIVLNDVLEHIPHHRTEELLRLVYRALRPGGVISVRVPNMSSILASFSMHLDFTHFVGYTEFSLMQVLDSAGFVDHRVVTSRPKLFLSLVAPLRSIKRFVRLLFYLTNKAIHLFFFLIRAQQLFPKTFEYNLEMYSNKPDGENDS